MDAGSSPDVPRWRRVALAVWMFLITGAIGFLQPFTPLYLEASGLTRGQVGLVVGLAVGTGLLIQPMLEKLSDHLDARRPVIVAAAVMAALAYFSYGSVQGVFLFILVTALGVNGYQYLMAVGGVLVGRMSSGPGVTAV